MSQPTAVEHPANVITDLREKLEKAQKENYQLRLLPMIVMELLNPILSTATSHKGFSHQRASLVFRTLINTILGHPVFVNITGVTAYRRTGDKIYTIEMVNPNMDVGDKGILKFSLGSGNIGIDKVNFISLFSRLAHERETGYGASAYKQCEQKDIGICDIFGDGTPKGSLVEDWTVEELGFFPEEITRFTNTVNQIATDDYRKDQNSVKPKSIVSMYLIGTKARPGDQTPDRFMLQLLSTKPITSHQVSVLRMFGAIAVSNMHRLILEAEEHDNTTQRESAIKTHLEQALELIGRRKI